MEVCRCGPRGQGRMCNCVRRPRGPPSRSVVKKLLRIGGCLHRIVGCGEVRAAIRVGAGALGREVGCRKLADQGESASDVGDGRRRRGHFCAVGDGRRRRGPESCPRTRRMSLHGEACARPRGMRPSIRGGRMDGTGRNVGVDGGVKRWMHHSRERGLSRGPVVVSVCILMRWLVRWIRLGLRGRCVGCLLLLD